VIEYAFVNLSGSTSYISDGNLAYRGTWDSGSLYNPPLDVVDYNNGKFIALATNSNEPPLDSPYWSELVIRGTVSPTDPFDIAQTALDAANAASVLALSASSTANDALSLAQSTYAIAASGTVAGTNIAIPEGTDTVFVSGLNLGFIPGAVTCTLEVPSYESPDLNPISLIGRPTSDGFTVRLNGTADGSGYYLHWMIRR
jgi:hypothetical protein